MRATLSIHEIRRRAPLHYEAKADNARYTAYLLDQVISRTCQVRAAKKASYNGSPHIARAEAFRREAALALELIIKGVIAQRIELGVAETHVVRVRPIHHLNKLWRDAALPTLSREDQRTLLLATRILVWAGRYAAPKDDPQYEKEQAEDLALKPPRSPGALVFEIYPRFDWETFDRLYEIAWTEFWKLRKALP